MANKTSRFAIIIAAIIILWFAYDYFAYSASLKKPKDPENKTKIMILVRKGENAKIIARNLYDKKIISNSRYFYRYIKNADNGAKIIAGGFMVSPSMTIPEIASIVTDPSKSQYSLTVPEGFSVKDIDKKLTEMELIKSGEFASAVKNFADYAKYDFLDKNTLQKLDLPLEGYLFPDTYFLSPDNFSFDSLIKKMLDNFNKKLAPEMQNAISRQNKTIHQIITMASILEKEGYTQNDFEMISGILWKRLKNNWLLDADAAILYITGKKTLSSADIEIDSPYNTRRKRGLPPGPISNPGLNAIKASISPKSSPYWFYLTEPKKLKTIYAKTNEEHNINKAKYLE